MRIIRASFVLLGATLLGCGATGSDGFDDSDAGTYTWPSGTTKDGGADGSASESSDGGSGSSSDGGSGPSSTSSDGGSSSSAPTDSGSVSTGSSDASTTTATGAACAVAPSGGFVGGPSQSTTFTGTATEFSPLAGSPQSLTLTITGLGEESCWSYDRCNAYVDLTTNLWGGIGSAASESTQFAAGVAGAVIEIIAPGGATVGSMVLRAKPRSTHFVGTYTTASASYSIAIDAPSGVVPCTAVPNCAWGGTTGDYCGESIDGYSDTMYHCLGSNPATVVETCPINCVAAISGGIECI